MTEERDHDAEAWRIVAEPLRAWFSAHARQETAVIDDAGHYYDIAKATRALFKAYRRAALVRLVRATEDVGGYESEQP